VADFHGRFVWYALATTDTKAAKAFYSNVIGWGTQEAPTPGTAYTLFTAQKAPVSGLMSLSDDAIRAGAPPSWIGYVGVNDIDATADRIKRLGGAVHVPPTDVSNVSRFSIVTDPQGATFALFKWLKAGDEQRPALGQLRHVGWHELLAADWENTIAFYGEIFGWQKANAHTGPMGTYQVFSADGQPIGGMFTKPADMPIPFWLYYFNVGDIDAAVERVTAGGGEILEGPSEVPPGHWVARCADPQGAMFALEGPRRRDTVGYFKPVARNPSGTRS
jgi:predicted enzyme related to lactoylglutathione lyase